MQKITIKNRKNQNVVVLLEKAEKRKGLAFVMHGNASNKDLRQIKTFAQVFKENGYTAIRFDTTNSSGESDGKIEDATFTNYYEDLEDVISWASKENFYQEPFILCGHSLGSMCVAYFAEKYPGRVKALAPISTVVSGKLSEETTEFKMIAKDWEKKGVREWASLSMPGITKRLKWQHVLDRRKYDLLSEAYKLTMPVLLIVGDKDETTPLNQQKLLYEKLPGRRELNIIKDACHAFKDKKYLEEIYQIMDKWIKNL
ncbi:MAG: alpha/beta hydrolase [Patescibacteria group bacterium]|jgi:pimeloyl-ACP methyl ester carboxylesterase